MRKRTKEICFDVFLNGKKLCTAGIGEGVLSASLIALKGRSTPRGRDAKYRDLSLTVGGLIVDPKTDDNSEFVKWFTKKLKVGDRLTFALKRSDKWDEPTERKKPTRNSTDKREKSTTSASKKNSNLLSKMPNTKRDLEHFSGMTPGGKNSQAGEKIAIPCPQDGMLPIVPDSDVLLNQIAGSYADQLRSITKRENLKFRFFS